MPLNSDNSNTAKLRSFNLQVLNTIAVLEHFTKLRETTCSELFFYVLKKDSVAGTFLKIIRSFSEYTFS